MQITCVITDDEPVARKGLQSYVEKVDFLTLTGMCENAMQLNTLLNAERPDLLFLDIEMPYLSGLDLLASLSDPPRVIVTSAYERYALQGYELDVTDYLLKPIPFERFLKAVNKVHALLQPSEPSGAPADFIFIRADRQMHKVFFKDILFVEGLENYVCVHTGAGRLLTRSTMKRISEMLPHGHFLQVHKSYIVNTDRIDLINGNSLVIGTHSITVARNFRDEVFARILKNTL